MNITHHIPSSLILGSVLAVSASPVWAGGQGVGSVEIISYPEGASDWVNIYFSGNGRLSMLHTYVGAGSEIYQYQDDEWRLIRRELRSVVPGITPFGVSADGNRIILSNFSAIDVVDGPLVTTLPRVWTYNEDHNGWVSSQFVYGTIHHGNISSNGQVVTAMGKSSGSSDFDSLVWNGGEDLVNLSEDLPRDEYDYGVGLPNEDGSAIVFPACDPGYPTASQARKIWYWSEGGLTEIPSPSLFDVEERSIRDISADGAIVFGTATGEARGGVSNETLSEVTHWSRPFFGQEIAWMWTESGGTVPIIDESRFLETRMISADADGSIALINARPRGSRYSEQYLWLGENKYIELDELFHSLNIFIDVEYAFTEISDDGTKLMGYASMDGRYYSYAIIVTIPDLTP